MKIDRFGDKEYWTVTEPSDLEGWTLMYMEDYKPGVKRLHVRSAIDKSPIVIRLLYCPDGIITKAQSLVEVT